MKLKQLPCLCSSIDFRILKRSLNGHRGQPRKRQCKKCGRVYEIGSIDPPDMV